MVLMPYTGAEPFLCAYGHVRSLLLFRVLQHRARIRSLRFVLGSPALCLDLTPSFCFGFSGIVLRFDPFVLFRVLQHRTRIRSLRFVSGSPASHPNSIPSFCFKFSGITTGFDPFVLFRDLWHRAQFDPFVLFQVLKHHDWIRSFFFLSVSPASCLDSIASFCFRFSGITPGFDPFILFQVLCIELGFDPFVLFQVL